MTKEEYRAHTSLQSVDEAHSLLNKTRILFIVEFIAIVLMRILATESSYVTYFAIWLAFTVYFVIHCMQITKKTKAVTKAWAAWAVIFAPISWIWFYPELVKPLHIIIGDQPPPEVIQPRGLSAQSRKNANAGFWRTVLIVSAISFVILSAIALSGLGG